MQRQNQIRLGVGLICLFGIYQAAFSQRLTRYEYWLNSNTDSRITRTLTTTSSEVNILDSMDVRHLPLGLNLVHFRFGTADRWSAAQSNFFYRLNTVGNSSVTTCEYWFEDNYNDRISKPIGNGSSNTIIMDSVNIASLNLGLHQFNIRFGGANGWSAITTQLFYKLPNHDGQQLNAYEYWFDDQTNHKVSRPLSANPTPVTILDSVSIENLFVGLHRFNIRFSGSNGWSSIHSQFFYKLQNNGNQSIAGYEYWFDDQFNNRTQRNVSNAVAMSGMVIDSINMSSLNMGLHRFNVRLIGSAGMGSVATHFFYKFNSHSNQLTGIEYWINNDSTSRKFKSLTLNSAGVVTDMIDISTLCKDTHRLTYRFQTMQGWSSTVTDQFYKSTPSAQGAIAGFKWTSENNLVACQNLAQNAQRMVWKFGNGDSSMLRNPFYTYSTAGVYQVCQIVSNNLGCPRDSSCQIINIRGIKSIIPNKSGKNSNVTVRILGGGFHDSTKVKFIRTGFADLVPKKTFVENSGSIRSSFEFRNTATGFWTVVLTLPNGDTMSLRNGFEILDSAKTDLWVKLSGDRIYRPGFQANYTISYGNNGESDAEEVLLFLNGLPRNSKIFISDGFMNVKLVPPYDTIRNWIDSIPNELLDSTTFDMYTGVLLPIIPAHSTGSVRVKIIIPLDVDLSRNFEVEARLSPLLTDSYNDCMMAIGELAEEELKKMFEESGAEVTKCWTKMILLPYETSKAFRNYAKTTPSAYSKFVLVKDFASTITSAFSACVKAGFVILPQSKLIKATRKIIDIFKKLNKGYEGAKIYYDISDKCGNLGTIAIDKIISGTGQSFDPNIKFGPGEGSTAHFFSSPSRIMPYTIMCENDSMATLPAQIITIIDTLDKTKLDPTSVGFTYVTLSDKTVNLSNAPQSFIADIDLSSTTGFIARIVGTVDTAKGIIRWVVNTLDPTTRQVSENPAAGILPPNRRKPEGEGAFGFIVNKRTGLPDSTTIANQASIIFDFNTPILTPTWKAVVDDTKPISQMATLDATQRDTGFTVRWTGRDNLSGIQSYEIYVSRNFAPYRLWNQYGARIDSARFRGERGITYRFYSIAMDSAGNIENAPITPDATTRIEGTNSISFIPKTNAWLGQNRPNPFQQTTEIPLYLDQVTPQLELVVFDITGKAIRRIQQANVSKGEHSIEVDLKDMASGVYFYQLKIGQNKYITKRMVLMSH